MISDPGFQPKWFYDVLCDHDCVIAPLKIAFLVSDDKQKINRFDCCGSI